MGARGVAAARERSIEDLPYRRARLFSSDSRASGLAPRAQRSAQGSGQLCDLASGDRIVLLTSDRRYPRITGRVDDVSADGGACGSSKTAVPGAACSTAPRGTRRSLTRGSSGRWTAWLRSFVPAIQAPSRLGSGRQGQPVFRCLLRFGIAGARKTIPERYGTRVAAPSVLPITSASSRSLGCKAQGRRGPMPGV